MGKMLILETTESKKKTNGVTGHVKKFKTNHGCSWTKNIFCRVIAEFIPLITIKTRKHQNKCVHPTALHV